MAVIVTTATVGALLVRAVRRSLPPSGRVGIS